MSALLFEIFLIKNAKPYGWALHLKSGLHFNSRFWFCVKESWEIGVGKTELISPEDMFIKENGI
jgi:hypothetical protein